MKNALLALAIVLIAVAAGAAGFDDSNPGVVRIWRGKAVSFKEVSCASAGDTALLSAAEAQNMMSVWIFNTDSTNYVTICPRAAGANQCNTAAKGFTILKQTGLPVDVSVRDLPMSCKGDTGAVTVEVFGELFELPTPTPTAIP